MAVKSISVDRLLIGICMKNTSKYTLSLVCFYSFINEVLSDCAIGEGKVPAAHTIVALTANTCDGSLR